MINEKNRGLKRPLPPPSPQKPIKKDWKCGYCKSIINVKDYSCNNCGAPK